MKLGIVQAVKDEIGVMLSSDAWFHRVTDRIVFNALFKNAEVGREPLLGAAYIYRTYREGGFSIKDSQSEQYR